MKSPRFFSPKFSLILFLFATVVSCKKESEITTQEALILPKENVVTDRSEENCCDCTLTLTKTGGATSASATYTVNAPGACPAPFNGGIALKGTWTTKTFPGLSPIGKGTSVTCVLNEPTTNTNIGYSIKSTFKCPGSPATVWTNSVNGFNVPANFTRVVNVSNTCSTN